MRLSHYLYQQYKITVKKNDFLEWRKSMNLDEMLAASGITGGAAADGKNVKSGFVTLI